MFEYGLRSGDDEADAELPALTVFWKERLAKREAYHDRFEATVAKLAATEARLQETEDKLQAAKVTEAKLQETEAKLQAARP